MKNTSLWLFADTEAGAEVSSLFYSFLCTAKINGVGLMEDLERLADIIVAARPLP